MHCSRSTVLGAGPARSPPQTQQGRPPLATRCMHSAGGRPSCLIKRRRNASVCSPQQRAMAGGEGRAPRWRWTADGVRF